MWICFNDAFVSVVEYRPDPNFVLVRARAYRHLHNIFGNSRKIIVTPNNDYRYRVLCDRRDWADIVSARIANLHYTNFKDSVKDHKLHELYHDFWYLHMMFQNGKKWWKKGTGFLFDDGKEPAPAVTRPERDNDPISLKRQAAEELDRQALTSQERQS